MIQYSMYDNFVTDGERMGEMLLGDFEIFIIQVTNFRSGNLRWLIKFEFTKIKTLCKSMVKGMRP